LTSPNLFSASIFCQDILSETRGKVNLALRPGYVPGCLVAWLFLPSLSTRGSCPGIFRLIIDAFGLILGWMLDCWYNM